MLSVNVAIDKPATSSSQPPAGQFAETPARTRPVAKIPDGPWLIAVDPSSGESSTASVTFNVSRAEPPLLEAFIAVFSMESTLRAVRDAAATVFGKGNVGIETRLENNPDLGGDFVQVDIRVNGLSRESFRRHRETFDLAVEALPETAGFDRLVVLASRSA